MSRTPIHAAVGLVTLLAFSGASSASGTGPDCREVHGSLVENIVIVGCTSPVGLCTVSTMKGGLKGHEHFTASSIIPSADTGTTGVVFVTGDSSITEATMGNKSGTLTLKNAAAYRTIGDNDLVDLQVVTGGTGDFAGATGTIRIHGYFLSTGTGEAEYEATICVP